MPGDPRPTYMSPEEFSRLGERCFGQGWQGTLAKYLDYNRSVLNRFAVGAQPVPQHVAQALRNAANMLDFGVPLVYAEVVGAITDSGFEPL